MAERITGFHQHLHNACDSGIESNKDHMQPKETKLSSADVKWPKQNDTANNKQTNELGNKDKLDKRGNNRENDLQESSTKLASTDVGSPAVSPEDLPISPASAAEEVEYRLVYPPVEDSPNSAAAGIEDLVNTLSSSSTEDYAVEALENTSSDEDTNPMAAEEQTGEESNSSSFFNAFNATERAELGSIRRKNPPFIREEFESLRTENTDADERKESRLIRSFDLHVKNGPSVGAEDSSKTTFITEDQPRKSNLSMADIIQRKLTMRLLDESNPKEEATATNEIIISSEGTVERSETVIRQATLTESISSIDKEQNEMSVAEVGSLDSADLKKDTDDIGVMKDKKNSEETIRQEEELVTEEVLKNDVTPNVDNMDTETSSEVITKSDNTYLKGETEEPKPSTSKSVSCQEDVVFAVPKLPPPRALSSKTSDSDIGNVEAIRMNLKLQLSSLRNRKRQHVQITTKFNDNFFSEAESIHSEKKSITKKSETVPQLRDELYTQTNELGLVILDVKGGVELEDEINKAADKKPEEITKDVKEDNGKSNVEDLVRQIISKKSEPKIRIRKDLTESPPVIDDFEIFQKRFDSNTIPTDPGPSTSTSKRHDEDMSNLDGALLYGENSQMSSSSNDKSLAAGEEKSPFVSNTLDEFLTGNAKLNVSYNIPKCDAEEGLRELHFESEPTELVLKKTVDPQQDVGETVKKVGKRVRTLAQKRKLLEKQIAREKKQKQREQKKERLEKKKQKEQNNLEDKLKDRSYVIEDGKKIWVNSFLPGRCILNIDEAKTAQPKISLPQNPPPKKLSLLENLYKKHQVKYSPGPLSKKQVLQVGGTTEWRTEVKQLPEVFVEVVPEFGHPLPPELTGRITFDAALTADHIEFALTALKTKNPPMEPARKFVLPVQYSKKQQQIVVRKKIPPPEPVNVQSVEQAAQKDAAHEASDDSDVISKVIDDLISYVEIKELAPSLIKDDDYDFTEEFPVENNKAQTVDEHLSVLKRSQKKRSRVDWELIRLNCKIVNVEVDLSKKCVVSLRKLNLDAVIFFCLQHDQYDCFCRGLSDYLPKDHPRLRTSEVNDAAPAPFVKPHQPQLSVKKTADKTKSRKRAHENAADHNLPEPVSKKRAVSETEVTDAGKQAEKDETCNESGLSLSGEATASDSDSPISSRPVRNKKATKSEFFEYPLDHEETCARVMEVKCRKQKWDTKNFELAIRNDFVHNYTQADLLKIKMKYAQKKRHLEVDILKQTLLADHLSSIPPSRLIVPVEPPFQKHINNRKQTLEAKSDNNPSVKQGTTKPSEIIINETSMDLLRKMGPRTVSEGFARLLPWRVLSDSFINGTINIWCMVDQPSRLLINKADKKAPKSYVDIRVARQPTEVIMWILRNKLPASYQEENVSFILRETKDNFEICGVCTKNLDTSMGGNVRRKVAIPPPPAHASTDTNGSGGGTNAFLEAGLSLKHRDMHHHFLTLSVCVERHNPQTLTSENSTLQPKITAHLPEIGSDYKWRLIHLKSDFSYLYFLKSNYSIKYMDLMIGARMGGKSKEPATVMLHSIKLKTDEDHPRMGIYFDQSLPNKMFIGPYSRSEPGENLAETLRYVNQKLVATEAFNKMSGKEDYR
nr:unnamed protein product [Callosobruchus analis]